MAFPLFEAVLRANAWKIVEKEEEMERVMKKILTELVSFRKKQQSPDLYPTEGQDNSVVIMKATDTNMIDASNVISKDTSNLASNEQ